MMPSRCIRVPGFVAGCLLAAAMVHAQVAVPPHAAATATAGADPETKVETLVFFRHGEKPPGDDGQLTVQGLNRALALPAVLIGKYGRADFLFSPASTKKEASHHRGTFSYVRPLMTIEPTAIQLGLPVETKFAFDEIAGLQSEICAPAYQRATVFIVWEHHLLDEIVRHIIAAYGGSVGDVPDWPDEDFDSLFVVRLRTDAQNRRSVTFEHDLEHLDGQSTAFPAPAANP